MLLPPEAANCPILGICVNVALDGDTVSNVAKGTCCDNSNMKVANTDFFKLMIQALGMSF